MTSRCNQSKNFASDHVSGSNGSSSSSVIYNRTEISQISLQMRLKVPTRTSPFLYKIDNKILQCCLYVQFSNGPDNKTVAAPMCPLQLFIHVVQNVTTMLESNRRTGRGQTNETNILNDVISLLLLS